MSRIIIYGPQGSGLSSFAKDLTEHYGKRLVVDGWVPGMAMPDNALILTSHEVEDAIHLATAVDEMWRCRIDQQPALFAELLTERVRQDRQHGGPAHDDMHAPMDWPNLVDYQLDKLTDEGGEAGHLPDTALVRVRLVKIGALAIAGIGSLDRLASTEQPA